MKTRPTPETDDSKTRVRKNGFSRLIEYCYANDMAKLERERDELKRWTSVNGVIDLQRERDEARAESIRWQSIAEGRGRTDDNEQCHTCGSTSTIDNGSACAQCGCDKSLTPNAKP